MHRGLAIPRVPPTRSLIALSGNLLRLRLRYSFAAEFPRKSLLCARVSTKIKTWLEHIEILIGYIISCPTTINSMGHTSDSLELAHLDNLVKIFSDDLRLGLYSAERRNIQHSLLPPGRLVALHLLLGYNKNNDQSIPVEQYT